MKTITKLAFLAAAVAAIGTSAAVADDQQLQNRLALQRAQASQKSTTIAVYAGHQGVVSRSAMQGQRPDLRFERRMNAKGQEFGIYVPLK